MLKWRYHFIGFLLASLGLATGQSPAESITAARETTPLRLIVLISVDQLRADYPERFRDQFTSGLKRLLENGAVFTQAHHDHATTVTACGHATLLSGLYPRSSGIIGNGWFDRRTNRPVEAIEDHRYPQLDNPQRGVAPTWFNGTTLVDWLLAKHADARVASVSGKDRAAALMVGARARHVYWYNTNNGRFTTSTYYQPSLPQWVADFNAQQIPIRYVGQRWSLLLGREDAYRASGPDDVPYEMSTAGFGRVFPHSLPEDPERLPEALVATPWLDEYTFQFAEATLKLLDLGRDDIPDLLAVSLSATDFIGHRFGPDSKEVHDQLLRLDRGLGEFFKFLDKQVGLKHTLIVLTGDHGVAPLPEYAAKQGKRAKRFQLDRDVQAYRQRLRTRWGDGEWLLHYQSGVLYFNHDALKQKGIALAEVTRDAAAYFSKLEPVARVYTRAQLMSRTEPADGLERRLRHSFHPDRSGDLFLVFKPYYLERAESTGTTHGSPYEYDSHVPLMFMGAGVKAGHYHQAVATVDIAPTLAGILRLRPLNPVDGRALTEIIVDLKRPDPLVHSAAKPTLPSQP